MHHLPGTLYQGIEVAIIFLVKLGIEITFALLFPFAFILLLESYLPSDQMYVFLPK